MTANLLRKRISGIRLLGLMAVVSGITAPALAELEVSASVQIHARAESEAPLSAHGKWVEVGSYGRCWHPAGVVVGWRPYCTGEWVWTDCGWYWESDEPWGWACYHYGYWVEDPVYGWVWVPGVEWAPAWVSWRVGGGYIGWAPLPPPGWFFAARPKFEAFVFVGSSHFGGPVRLSSVSFKNRAIFGETAEVGGMKRETRRGPGASSQRVMVNQGPKVEEVQKATGRTFKAVPIREAVRKTIETASAKGRGTEPKFKPESHDPGAPFGRGAEQVELKDAPGKDHPGPSSSGFWHGGGPRDHGAGGGGGHGKGRG